MPVLAPRHTEIADAPRRPSAWNSGHTGRRPRGVQAGPDCHFLFVDRTRAHQRRPTHERSTRY